MNFSLNHILCDLIFEIMHVDVSITMLTVIFLDVRINYDVASSQIQYIRCNQH